MELTEVISYAIGLLGGGGGVVALYRARGQNRVDAGRLALDAQAAFQQGLASEVSRLSALVQVLGGDKDKLEERLGDQGRLLERLKTLDEIKTGQIEKLEAQNTALSLRVDEQQHEIKGLRDEKAAAVEQLKIVSAAKDFLERENGELRREVAHLRGLPASPLSHGEP